ncbi:MAG: hypothetical protein ACYDC2_00580 [Solirubrobacteraceae bacterium]
MATRTIVTSQPDVACDVCARRLLRGEQPDVFIAAGRRRTVCELCAPRAVLEGWQRESEHDSLSLPPMRPRRGRGLFQRLLQVARPLAAEPADGPPTRRASRGARRDDLPDAGYDLLDPHSEHAAEPPSAHPYEERYEERSYDGRSDEGHDGEEARPAGGEAHLLEALEVFNASGFPRRVSGVARSLGPPAISVRSAEHLASVVRIAVAWELCWYRYEVDLSEEEIAARSRGQGTELSELQREELEANAQADSAGAIHLVA